jgi:predicted nucleic acid-binding protein
MGVINLPPSGKAGFDTNSLIYTVEAQEPYFSLLQPVWQAAHAGQITLVASELLILETLVMPLRNQDTALIDAYAQAMSAPGVRLVAITPAILLTAAQIRAGIPGVRTPDAIHAASALEENISVFITNDPGFQRIPGLQVILLSDVLAAP